MDGTRQQRNDLLDTDLRVGQKKITCLYFAFLGYLSVPFVPLPHCLRIYVCMLMNVMYELVNICLISAQ